MALKNWEKGTCKCRRNFYSECPCEGGQRTGVAAGELRPRDRFVVVVVLCVILNRRSKCVFVFEESCLEEREKY